MIIFKHHSESVILWVWKKNDPQPLETWMGLVGQLDPELLRRAILVGQEPQGDIEWMSLNEGQVHLGLRGNRETRGNHSKDSDVALMARDACCVVLGHTERVPQAHQASSHMAQDFTGTVNLSEIFSNEKGMVFSLRHEARVLLGREPVSWNEIWEKCCNHSELRNVPNFPKLLFDDSYLCFYCSHTILAGYHTVYVVPHWY